MTHRIYRHLLLTAMVVLLLLGGCGPPRPGAMTPTLPPASVWQLHYEAGLKASEEARYQEAEQLLTTALREAESLRLWNPDDPDARVPPDPSVASTRLALGNVYAIQGKNRDATEQYQQALRLATTTVGPGDPFAGMVLHRMGLHAARQGQFADAEGHYIDALSIIDRGVGSTHPATASVLQDLGNLYAAQGRMEDAERYHRRALAIREAALGPEDPAVADSLDGLMVVEFSRGRIGHAKGLHRRALQIRVKALGSDHPTVIASLGHFAELLRQAEATAEPAPPGGVGQTPAR